MGRNNINIKSLGEIYIGTPNMYYDSKYTDVY